MHGDAILSAEDWLRETEADDERRIRALHTLVTGKRLLDFGCGAGGFLLRARQHASLVVGVEPERRLQAHFQQVGLIVHSKLEEVTASGSTFDCISGFHVVEHLPDPRATVRQLASLLTEGGELVLEVPSSDDALLTLYESEAFMRFTYWSQHLFLFNAQTFSELVRQAGLSVRWVKQVQRYPLSNHLHWLARGKPGGHKAWGFLNTPLLNDAYAAQLAAVGKCDTIMTGIGRS